MSEYLAWTEIQGIIAGKGTSAINNKIAINNIKHMEKLKTIDRSKLKAQAKAILNNNPIGYSINSESQEFVFLISIFNNHPHWHHKTGCGIDYIFIWVTAPYRTRCFFIKRTDGSTTDISYIQSIEPQKTKISDIKCACRSAIREIVANERNKVLFGKDVCPITGEILFEHNTHIDHYNLPFDQLLKKWLKTENVDLVHACLNDSAADNEVEIKFTSSYLRQDFIDFHDANTHLRAVSKLANLSILKRG